MVNPLDLAFKVLTLGIDKKLPARYVRDPQLELDVLSTIQERPGLPLSALERSFENKLERVALVPSILARAQYDGVVGFDSYTSIDPVLSLTDSGSAYLKNLRNAS